VRDNAENNKTMISALAHILPKFKGQEAHIRCFAHVLNFVIKVSGTCLYCILLNYFIQAILSQFSQTHQDSIDDDDNESDSEMLADLDDQDIDEDEEGESSYTDQNDFDSELLDEIEGEVSHNELMQEDINLGQFSIYKVMSFCIGYFCYSQLV
jgi:hypothetical protein